MSFTKALFLSVFYRFAFCLPAPNPDPSVQVANGMLAARQAVGSTANDLQDGDCKAMTLIFARGTTETGNMGTIVGPPFANALQQAAGEGNVAVQGVNDYPADVQGFLAGGDAGGTKEMANQVQQAMTSCPNTQVVMSGYRSVVPTIGKIVHKLPCV